MKRNFPRIYAGIFAKSKNDKLVKNTQALRIFVGIKKRTK